MHPVYEPNEDSFLILKQVPKYARGNVLDMGTGSGIIAVEAAKYAKNVLAVDLNPYAVAYAHKKTQHIKNLIVKQSNLFQNITGKFDTIFFNPPYLPNDPRLRDLALDGGPKGFEVIHEFLLYAGPHLKKSGTIVLLFSSLSKPEEIHKILHANGYKYKPLSRLKLDFEELYVYEIRLNQQGIPRKRKTRDRIHRLMERKKSGCKNKKSKKHSSKPHRK